MKAQQSPFQSLSPLQKDAFSGRKINPSLNSQVVDFRTSNIAKRIPQVIEVEDAKKTSNSSSKQFWKSQQFTNEEDLLLHEREFGQNLSPKSDLGKGSLQLQQNKLKKIVALQSPQVQTKNASQNGFKKNFLSVTCGAKEMQTSSGKQRNNQLHLSNSIEMDNSAQTSYIYPFSYISHKNGISNAQKSSNQSASNLSTTKAQQLSYAEISNMSVEQGKDQQHLGQKITQCHSGQVSQQRRTPQNGQLNSVSSQVTPQGSSKGCGPRFFVSPKAQKKQSQANQTNITTPNQSSNEMASKSAGLKKSPQIGFEMAMAAQGEFKQLTNENDRSKLNQNGQQLPSQNIDQMLSQISPDIHQKHVLLPANGQGMSAFQQYQILTAQFQRKDNLTNSSKMKSAGKNKKKKEDSSNSKGIILQSSQSTSAIGHSLNQEEEEKQPDRKQNINTSHEQFLFEKQSTETKIDQKLKNDHIDDQIKKKKHRKKSPYQQLEIDKILQTNSKSPSLKQSLKRKQQPGVQDYQSKYLKSSQSPHKPTSTHVFHLSNENNSNQDVLQHRSARQINHPTLNTVKSADDLLILARSQANEQNGEQIHFEKNKDGQNEMFSNQTNSKAENIVRQNLQKIKLQKMIEQQKQSQEQLEKAKRAQYLNEVNQQIRLLNSHKSPKREHPQPSGVASSVAATTNSSSGHNQAVIAQSHSPGVEHRHAWGANQQRLSQNGNTHQNNSNGLNSYHNNTNYNSQNDKQCQILKTSQEDSRNPSFMHPMTSPSSPSFNDKEKQRRQNLGLGFIYQKNKPCNFNAKIKDKHIEKPMDRTNHLTQQQPEGLVSQIKHISLDDMTKKKISTNPENNITDIQKYMALKKKAYEETEHMKEFEKACRERKIQENKIHLELNTKTILRRIQPTMKKNKKNHTTKTGDNKDAEQLKEYYPIQVGKAITKNQVSKITNGSEDNHAGDLETGNYSFLYEQYKRMMTDSMNSNNISHLPSPASNSSKNQNNNIVKPMKKQHFKLQLNGTSLQSKEQERPQNEKDRRKQPDNSSEFSNNSLQSNQETQNIHKNQNNQNSEITGQGQLGDQKENQKKVETNNDNPKFVSEKIETIQVTHERKQGQLEQKQQNQAEQKEERSKYSNNLLAQKEEKDRQNEENLNVLEQYKQSHNNQPKQDERVISEEDQLRKTEINVEKTKTEEKANEEQHELNEYNEDEQYYLIAMQYLDDSAVLIQKTWRGYQTRKLLRILLDELSKEQMGYFEQKEQVENPQNDSERQQQQQNQQKVQEEKQINRDWLDKQEKHEVETFFMKDQDGEEEEEKVINISTIKSSSLSNNEHIPEDGTEQFSKRSENDTGNIADPIKIDCQQEPQNDETDEILRLKELEIAKWNALATQLQDAFQLTPHHRQDLLQELQQISEMNKNQLINSLPFKNLPQQASNGQPQTQENNIPQQDHQRQNNPSAVEQKEPVSLIQIQFDPQKAEEIDDILQKNNQDAFDEEEDGFDESHQHHQSDDAQGQQQEEESKDIDHDLNIKKDSNKKESSVDLKNNNPKDQEDQNLSQLYFLLSQESSKDKERKYCSYSSSINSPSNQNSQKNSARYGKPILIDNNNNIPQTEQPHDIYQQHYQLKSQECLSPTAMSQSFFERDSFKLFTEKKLKELQKNNQIEEIAKLREEAIKMRHSTQVELMNRMLQDNTVTPRTYFSGKQELDKWEKDEQDELKMTMQSYDQSLKKAIQSISKSQRDYDFTKKYQESLKDYPKITAKSPSNSKELDNVNSSVKPNLVQNHNQLKIEGLRGLTEDSPAHSGKTQKTQIQESVEDDFIRVQDASPSAALNNSSKSISVMQQKTNNSKKEQITEYHENQIKKDDNDHSGVSIKEQSPSDQSKVSPKMKDQEGILNSTSNAQENNQKQNFESKNKQYEQQDKDVFRELDGQEDLEKLQGKIDARNDSNNNDDKKTTEQPSEKSRDILISKPDKTSIKNEIENTQNNSEILHSPSKNSAHSGSGDKKEEHGNFNTQAIQANEVFNSINDEIKEKWKMNAQVEERLNEQLNKLECIDKSDRYGIPSNIFIIDQYLISLFNHVKTYCKAEFIENVNTPFGFTPQKRLKLIHGYDSYLESTSEQQLEEFSTLPFVLSEELFIDFEQNFVGNGQEEKDQIIKEFQHIHNKAIFDTFNESLNLFRPFFSLGGSPYAWSKSEKNIIFWTATEENYEKILEKAKKKVIEWASFLCGIINEHENNNQRGINSEDDSMSDEKDGKNQQDKSPLQSLFDSSSSQPENEYFAQTREERLSRMLLVEIFENEFKWQLYEDEKAEVLMELSDLVFEELVEELVDEIADQSN